MIFQPQIRVFGDVEPSLNGTSGRPEMGAIATSYLSGRIEFSQPLHLNYPSLLLLSITQEVRSKANIMPHKSLYVKGSVREGA